MECVLASDTMIAAFDEVSEVKKGSKCLTCQNRRVQYDGDRELSETKWDHREDKAVMEAVQLKLTQTGL